MDALSPSRSSSRKRSSPSPLSAAEHVVDVARPAEDDQPLAKKKRAPRSTAAEKHQRKVARMERNRVAAQVSRDRKKLQTEFLEARVAELEAQLAGGPATASSTSPNTLPPTPASLPALPALPALPDLRTVQLEEENEALKTQLALEKLQSQSLQIRLSALESKFNRLEQLLVQAQSTPAARQPEQDQAHLMPTATTTMEVANGTMEADSSRLVAREVDLSLQRKLSHPSFLPLPSSSTTSTRSSASNSTSLLPPRPSLHQILSSIRTSALPSSAMTSSRRPGPIGQPRSTLRLLRLRSPRTISFRLSTASSTSSSTCDKMRFLRARRLRRSTRQ